MTDVTEAEAENTEADADKVETPEQATRRRRKSVWLFFRDILF